MIGIFSALGASISWTYACFIWRTQTVKYQSIDINLLKNIIAFIIFFPTLSNFETQSTLHNIPILLLSGIVGIGLGDTFYIKSLQMIGTRRTLSVETLSPIIAALSGELFINENLSMTTWIGIIIVSTSLFFILTIKTNLTVKNLQISKRKNFSIFLYPFLSVLCAVFGGLLSRIVFLQSNLSPFYTTEIRLLGAIIFLVTIKRFKINFYLTKLEKNEQKRFLLSILLGTNLGILLQQIVFKTLPIGIGWTLLSISPLISLFFARKEEEKVTQKTIFFTGILFVGISLIVL